MLRLAALAAGAPASELFHEHVLALDALVTDWHGQQWVDLPGHVARAARGVLVLEPGPSGARLRPRLTPTRHGLPSHVENDLVNVLFTEEQIRDRLGELAERDRA